MLSGFTVKIAAWMIGFQVTLFFVKHFSQLFEHNVCCVLNLIDSPCVAEAECSRGWAVTFCKSIQNLMEVFQVDPVRELLGGFHI